jgi:hypothetical protein
VASKFSATLAELRLDKMGQGTKQTLNFCVFGYSSSWVIEFPVPGTEIGVLDGLLGPISMLLVLWDYIVCSSIVFPYNSL